MNPNWMEIVYIYMYFSRNNKDNDNEDYGNLRFKRASYLNWNKAVKSLLKSYVIDDGNPYEITSLFFCRKFVRKKKQQRMMTYIARWKPLFFYFFPFKREMEIVSQIWIEEKRDIFIWYSVSWVALNTLYFEQIKRDVLFFLLRFLSLSFAMKRAQLILLFLFLLLLFHGC